MFLQQSSHVSKLLHAASHCMCYEGGSEGEVKGEREGERDREGERGRGRDERGEREREGERGRGREGGREGGRERERCFSHLLNLLISNKTSTIFQQALIKTFTS